MDDGEEAVYWVRRSQARTSLAWFWMKAMCFRGIRRRPSADPTRLPVRGGDGAFARAVPMNVLAYLSDPDVVERILRHLTVPTVAPPLAAACGSVAHASFVDFRSQLAHTFSPNTPAIAAIERLFPRSGRRRRRWTRSSGSRA
jgi:hypothetical protein